MKAARIDRYFLSEPCAFTAKRTLKKPAIVGAAIAGTLLAICGLLASGSDQAPAPKKSTEAPTLRALPQDGQRLTAGVSNQLAPPSSHIDAGYEGRPPLAAAVGTPLQSRQRSASQLVSLQDETSGGLYDLPLGTLIPAVLANAIVSSDQTSPAIAIVTQDAVGRTNVAIPEGTKVYGQASMDETNQRLQVRFNTLVLPDGHQKEISAIAMMADGSAGLSGDVDRRILERQGGNVAGSFVGGLAEGMKDKRSEPGGITFEPGSVRNGLLGGVAEAALSQARDLSSQATQAMPIVTLPQGFQFLLFLDRGQGK